MLITLTSTAPSASDLSHLLRKHPAKAQSFDLAVGTAHVVYPEATDDRCTVALLLEVDPIALVRDRRFRSAGAGSITHYVNDRPYASSSMLAVALGQVFRTAMGGRSDTFPELAASALPLTVTVAALPARGGADLVRDLFAPLGWRVDATPVPLDPAFPAWGDSRYVDLVLTGEVRLADALRHLYVLLPVLDDGKHYWVSEDEVGKLLRAGEGWLTEHPARDLITRRYLAHQRDLVGEADDRLDAGSDAPADPAAPAPRTPSLARLRAETVHAVLTEVGARTVADVGCGSGALLAHLVADPAFTRIIGTDVSTSDLEAAARRLGLRDASDRARERIQLLPSSVTYEDPRIAGLDAIVLMEVIEHVDPDRHAALEASVFGSASPAAVVVTTPNAEHNALYPGLAAGALRHPDHRFEWTRAEFAAWAERVADRFGYRVEIRPVGDADPVHGSPTQLALFRKATR
ncbi:3' terminal RNA ribose 2'-O-methyltransferase Hen1 [Clavibacter michiganensis]|uniref:Small RNA 2'-O-methyltransferase n=1 Tax=Clavibacter michiganensis subsp. insidiosus TaxID=33014 RepID=A0A0D5CK09_9MICO|nr:3' terminal RNA ribose 2'-O-methyltransferase Hen1 [Clavibacter michiganensis]AJW79597.1 methyltransferase type 12 [Clavibacter michiganensis subsp. insidiosus]AWF97635.1 3' terminal RNA ribose 2'-O-methyltransferase Hen1 [Clavibacter michiganensis subsp. insidiosus]